MHLLPRSRRGTWLLAGAVWFAACAGWWEVLPDGPRARFECEPLQSQFRFLADGSSLLCFNFGQPSGNRIWFGSRQVPYAALGCTIRDLGTGDILRQWRPNSDAYALSWSGDWAVTRTSKTDPTPVLRDLRTGECQTLPWPKLGEDSAADVTCDGELLVIVTRSADARTTTTYWWDLRNRKSLGVFENRDPVALAPDGRWLTWDTYGVDLRVAGRASEEPVATIRPAREFELAEFSPDGRYVLLIAVDACQVFDAATGRLCAALPNAVAVIPPGTDRLTAINRTSWELETWDLKTGERLSSQPLAADKQSDTLLDVWRAPATNSLVLNWISPPPMDDLFSRIPYLSRLLSGAISEVQTVRGTDGAMSERRRIPFALGAHMSPDVQSMLVTTSGSEVLIYDIPPRRSMTWFAAGAAMLAMPIAFVAWWRGRNLIA